MYWLASVLAAFALMGYLAWPNTYFIYSVQPSLVKQIHPGDSVDHAIRVLNNAGLPNSVDRFDKAHPKIQSVYRTRHGAGYSIAIYLDGNDKVANIVFEPFYTFL
jgi:hypothetical protein